MYKYKIQSTPEGYRIVKDNSYNYESIIDNLNSVSEENLKDIIRALQESYNQGYSDACDVLSTRLGIIIDY